METIDLFETLTKKNTALIVERARKAAEFKFDWVADAASAGFDVEMAELIDSMATGLAFDSEIWVAVETMARQEACKLPEPRDWDQIGRNDSANQWIDIAKARLAVLNDDMN